MRRLLFLVLALAMAAWIVLIGLGGQERQSLMRGLMDPVFGIDHFLVLLAVGVWAGRLGTPELRTLPAAFLAGAMPGFFLALGPA